MNTSLSSGTAVAASLHAPLAAPAMASQVSPGIQQYLTFLLAGERHAINILSIREIIEYTQLTEVPMMPPHVRGVINLRGAVVPVLDLCARFHGQCAQINRRSCIIIVESPTNDRQDMGLLVDSVCAVHEFSPQDIEPAPSFGSHIRSDYIQGMARLEQQFIVLLALENLLGEDLADVRNPAALA